MKFGKEFASQMVPEWQEKYMDYNFLKTILKDILHFRRQNESLSAPVKRRESLYRAFSGLTSRYGNCIKISSEIDQKEEEVILAGAMQQQAAGSEGNYQSIFLKSSEQGGEYELVFFRRLDDEFNKVVKFYKIKLDEVIKEAEKLNRQMDALIAFRIKVDYRVGDLQDGNGFASSSPFLSPVANDKKPGE